MTKQALINVVVTVSLLFVLAIGQQSSRVLGFSNPSQDGTTAFAKRNEQHYTMKASVRPLLFWISRDGVGGGHIIWTEEADGSKGLELLIGSDPDRAPRQINRWGYIAERVCGSSAELIGLMTQADEQSIKQADVGTSRTGNMHTFKAIRCRLNGGEAQSTIIRMSLAEDFTYRNVDDRLSRIPETGTPIRQLQVPAGTDPGFLFAVKAMLHDSVERYRKLGHLNVNYPTPRRYVYCASLFKLYMVSSRFLGSVAVNGHNYAGIIESEFEARNTTAGEISRFRISYGTDDPILEMPVRIVYQPRWWFQAELLLNEDIQTAQAAKGVGGKWAK